MSTERFTQEFKDDVVRDYYQKGIFWWPDQPPPNLIKALALFGPVRYFRNQDISP